MATRRTLRPEELLSFLESLDVAETLVYAVFSHPREPLAGSDRSPYGYQHAPAEESPFIRQGQRCSKVKLRPVALKGSIQLQAEFQFGPKTFHQQYPLASDAPPLREGIHNFTEGTLFTSRADYQFHWTAAGLCRIVEQPPTKKRESLAHNRQKSYHLSDGEPVPFLVELGVMDTQGRVYPKKYDKFRQINKYLEFLEDALRHFPKDKPLYIVDFGSGKAYLTFALYHYLMDRGYSQFRVTGLDLKDDVVAFCNDTARRLGYDRLHFEVGDIANFQVDEGSPVSARRPDMIISLHACDIATDAALVKGLQWGCPVILAVPCCQHEFFHQLAAPGMDPIIRYGVSRDKQATLVTDASRALMLRAFGYSVELVEFITMEHTPKNVLIRSYREGSTGRKTFINMTDSGYRAYRDFLDLWGVGPTYLEQELIRSGLLKGTSKNCSF
jgi:SAM-dependent methyltransferase